MPPMRATRPSGLAVLLPRVPWTRQPPPGEDEATARPPEREEGLGKTAAALEYAPWSAQLGRELGQVGFLISYALPCVLPLADCVCQGRKVALGEWRGGGQGCKTGRVCVLFLSTHSQLGRASQGDPSCAENASRGYEREVTRQSRADAARDVCLPSGEQTATEEGRNARQRGGNEQHKPERFSRG